MPTAPQRFGQSAHASRRQSDRERDKQAYRKWYKTQKWVKARAWFLKQPENMQCVKCGRMATQIDHVKPASRYPELFWLVENWAPICGPCNAAKGSRE